MSMLRTTTRKKLQPEPLRIYSLSMTEKDAGVLAALAQEASGQLGRSISTSAVLRAILKLVAQALIPEPAIIEFVERELESGRKWGKEPQG